MARRVDDGICHGLDDSDPFRLTGPGQGQGQDLMQQCCCAYQAGQGSAKARLMGLVRLIE
jgi:hypothetical protein